MEKTCAKCDKVIDFDTEAYTECACGRFFCEECCVGTNTEPGKSCYICTEEARKKKVKLNWTPETDPNNECCYTHTMADTPFGRFLLTWKGWKEDIYCSMGFDEMPWEGSQYGFDSVEDAQKWAEEEYARRLKQAYEEIK